MDEDGNILVKRISKSNVYVKSIDEDNAISAEVMRLPSQALELERPIKVSCYVPLTILNIAYIRKLKHLHINLDYFKYKKYYKLLLKCTS